MIKAIFFDIDGTLVSFKTHKIPQSTLTALKQLREQGIKLFIATGRAPSSANFVSNYFDFDGFVCMSGQYCYDKTGILHSDPIEHDQVLAIADFLNEHGLGSAFETANTIYFNKITNDMMMFLKKLGKIRPDGEIIDIHKVKDPIYQTTTYITAEQEPDLMKNFPDLKAMRWYPLFANIIKKTGGKAVGISKVMENYGWNKDEVMTFGDADNDLDMLQLTNYSTCLGNGTPIAKQTAKYVTTDIDNDGVFNALKHFGVL